jgi:phosphopantothenoylcysteine synthetase/decarboxylase
LTCIALALNPEAKILVAPAMNGKMWQHPAVQRNVTRLMEDGCRFIGPAAGDLACGYQGVGRMTAVEDILAALQLPPV